MTPYASYVAMAIMDSLSVAICGFFSCFFGVVLIARSSSRTVTAIGYLLAISGFIVALLGIFLALSPHVPEGSTFFTVRQDISGYSRQS